MTFDTVTQTLINTVLFTFQPVTERHFLLNY
jgi:hypothetical protein